MTKNTGSFEQPKRHKKAAPPISAEEQTKILAAKQKAAEESKAEAERIELYGAAVGKMSHRQLRGELRRAIRREYTGKPPQPQAGLTIGLSTILLAVLENTQTSGYRRKDQINPTGKLHAYPI